MLTTLMTELLHTQNGLVSIDAHYVKVPEGKLKLIVACELDATAPNPQQP